MLVVRKSRQLGISMLGILFWVAFLGSGLVLAAQVFPTVVEYQTIVRVLNRVKTGSTVQEIRSAFDRATEIDNIKSITAKDLDISKSNNDRVVIKFAYESEIHLFGPAYLTIKYSGDVR
jgi:Domain of unknown function (DUF4845)